VRKNKLYAVYDYGTKKGEHTSKEITDLYCIPRQVVSNYADTDMTYKGRFSFEEVEQEEEKDSLALEWEEITKEVAERLRGGNRKYEPVKN
jgi:precorrin-2 methylase